MKKPILEYVISGCAFGFFPNENPYEEPLKLYVDDMRKGYKAISQIYNETVPKLCKNYIPETSTLFNGFTETGIARAMREFNNAHMKRQYADSGGLQIVTRGLTVDDQIKQTIYETQSQAHFAMCFDEISLIDKEYEAKSEEAKAKHERTKNERTNWKAKKFIEEEALNAAQKTAQNVKEQVQYFRDHNAKTKVIIIVQGNSAEFMLDFYREIAKVLTEEDYEHIGGVAIADTCIGTGQLQSVMMLRAAHLISQECHPAVRQQLHILGVGSVARLVPVIYLLQSGYLDKFSKVSYDSSTHSSSFTFGNLKLGGRIVKLGANLNVVSFLKFQDIYKTYESYLKTFITFDEYKDFVYCGFEQPKAEEFGTKESLERGKGWSYGRLRRQTLDPKSRFFGGKWAVLCRLLRPMFILYELMDFMPTVDKVFDRKFKIEDGDMAYYTVLRNCKDDEHMKDWLKHQKQTDRINSKQIDSGSRQKKITIGSFI